MPVFCQIEEDLSVLFGRGSTTLTRPRRKGLRKAQVLKFWQALRSTTNVNEVINSFKNKPGCDGERTLVRYAQADKGFREGLSTHEVAAKTGWKSGQIEKFRPWWREAFSTEGKEAALPSISEVPIGERRENIPDPELGPHSRELFYYGLRLRDRLSPCYPISGLEIGATGKQLEHLDIWEGRSGWQFDETPEEFEERKVEAEWGAGRYDARTHSVFLLFKGHLADQPCWDKLDQVKESYMQFRQAFQLASEAAALKVRQRLPDLPIPWAEAMTNSIMRDAWSRVTAPSGGLAFSYRTRNTDEGFYLQLGAWTVGPAPEAAQLQPLALAHRELILELPSLGEIQVLGKSTKAVNQLVVEFQEMLRPDAFMRKLFSSGHCNYCS
jgi:hypothetical protein